MSSLVISARTCAKALRPDKEIVAESCDARRRLVLAVSSDQRHDLTLIDILANGNVLRAFPPVRRVL